MKTPDFLPTRICLSTLRETDGESWSRPAMRALFGGKKVSPILDFDLPEFHQFRSENSNRISISGVQEKISVRVDDGKLVPTETDGQFILKPIPSLPSLQSREQVPANEHLSMQIAGQVFGIHTPPSSVVYFSDGSPAYLVKRFDRDPDTGKKRPQEDFCQLSNRTSTTYGQNYKYDGSYEEIGEILRQYCGSYPIEIEKLFRLIVFTYVIGNGDAHFKNFSLVPTPIGDFVLSPAYDLLSTRLHMPTESALALDLFADDFETDSYRENAFYTGADFRELANRFGMKPKRADHILIEATTLRQKSEPLVERSLLSDEAQSSYLETLQDRVRAIAAG